MRYSLNIKRSRINCSNIWKSYKDGVLLSNTFFLSTLFVLTSFCEKIPENWHITSPYRYGFFLYFLECTTFIVIWLLHIYTVFRKKDLLNVNIFDILSIFHSLKNSLLNFANIFLWWICYFRYSQENSLFLKPITVIFFLSPK